MVGGDDRNMPEAGKFNGGQKLLFWLLAVCMALLILSGIVIWRSYFSILFPVTLIRFASVVHAVAGAIIIALILYLKGYRIRGILSLDMPSNWTSLHPALKPKNIEAIIKRAQPRATAFMEKILAGAPVWFTLNNLWEVGY